jgi:two-component system NtrC family sensor kinase
MHCILNTDTHQQPAIMRKIKLFLLIWMPFLVLAQSSDVLTLDSLLIEGWTPLTKNWKFNKGDDLNWAQPGYDDSQWKSVKSKSNNLNSNGDSTIANKNEIIWFRRAIKIDSILKDNMVFNIVQTGASEIYLDGKLLYTFGVVSSNPKTVEHNSAYDDLFVFPLVPGKEQILAIRYATGNPLFPLYNGASWISIQLATITTLNSPDVSLNNGLAITRVGQNFFNISLGATSLISILFFTLFLFFPKEKINGYFALSTFFLSLYLIARAMGYTIATEEPWLYLSSPIVLSLGLLLMLLCIYRIFDLKLGFWFFTLCFLFLTITIGGVVYKVEYEQFVLLLYLFTIIVLSIRAYKTHRIAALIFLSCIGLIFVYFVSGIILNALEIDTSASDVYFSGLSFMLLPLSIAIYLGYHFSQRSISLGLQLVEVKRLSAENTKILSVQKSTLEQEVTQRTAELKNSINNLKATQSQLIQSEKMASLGELTAGIAHEIQNPLNFVNNFSEVSSELVDEMKQELDKGDIEEAKAISKDIKQNLEKINHHGKRADSIVKGMLQHSRASGDKKEPTNINALSDEYLRLAYHGLRAKDKSFNADLVTDFDESITTVNVIPQDLGRVVLNLLTNAFYAVNEKQKLGLDNYQPKVSICTKKHKDNIEIKVTDNGNGMPKSVQEKIFQPFFTTKPSGQGTGLGLSMSYDIITKRHEGELQVESTENQGTTFRIILPLNKTI